MLAMPTVPTRASRYEPELDWKVRITGAFGLLDNCAPFDATGHPAISIPCAKVDGLPVGLMLIARHFDEAVLLKIAHAFEQHVDWEAI